MTRFPRVLQGIGVTSIGQLTSVVSRLLEIPIVVGHWGAQTYGVWLILNVIPTLLTSSDFGLGTVADRVMARHVAIGELDKARWAYRTAAAFSLVSSIIFAIAATALFAFDIAQRWIGLAGVDKESTLAVVALLSIRVVVQMMSRISQAALFAVGEYPRAMLWAGFADLALFIGLIGTVFIGGSLIWASFTQLVVTVFAVLGMQWNVRRSAEWARLGIQGIGKSAFREMWAPGTATLFLSVSRSLNYTLPRIIVASVGGPVSATAFFAHRQLARLITFMLLFGRPLQAEIALMPGGPKDPNFVKYGLRVVQLFNWICLGSAIMVVALSSTVFPHWSQGQVSFMPQLFVILVVTSLFEGMTSSALIPLAGVNRHVRVSFQFSLINTLLLVLSFPLVRQFGLAGMAIGLLVIDLSTWVLALRSVSVLLDLPARQVLAKTLAPPIWLSGKIRATVGL